MISAPRWLSRYQNGQRDRVWQELRELGGAVRQSDHLAQEAQLVCDEMAHRARHNVELIVERLTRSGYRFHLNNDEQTPVQPHIPPGEAAAGYAEWLQQRFDAVPMTLLSWVRIVGEVWLVGTHPDWSGSASADPLVIELERSRAYGEHLWTRWQASQSEEPDDGRLFVLPVAPDRFHKDNTSGGAPYGIVLPDGCVDGLFRWETTMPFVSYLNWVFSEGGFPWPSGDPSQWRVRHRLVKDMLPL